MSKKNELHIAKMYSLVQEYESGNQSQKEFCRSKGIKVSYLNYWIGRYRKDSMHSDIGTKLIPIEVEKSLGRQIKVLTPQGLEIYIPV